MVPLKRRKRTSMRNRATQMCRLSEGTQKGRVVCHVKVVDWYRLTDHYFMDGSNITLPPGLRRTAATALFGNRRTDQPKRRLAPLRSAFGSCGYRASSVWLARWLGETRPTIDQAAEVAATLAGLPLRAERDRGHPFRPAWPLGFYWFSHDKQRLQYVRPTPRWAVCTPTHLGR
jgi:hypothetical protein